jgi:hypothetical protein
MLLSDKQQEQAIAQSNIEEEIGSGYQKNKLYARAKREEGRRKNSLEEGGLFL